MSNKKISSEHVYRGRIINLRVDQVELPNGRRTVREVIEHPGAAAIVPVDAGGRVHMVRQYRDAIGEELLEIPAGKLKPGEDPRESAMRELGEELGYSSERMTHLATFYSTPGFCDEVMHMFLAEGLKKSSLNEGREEFIVPVTRGLEPVDRLLAELKDAKSVAGILLAHRVISSRKVCNNC